MLSPESWRPTSLDDSPISVHVLLLDMGHRKDHPEPHHSESKSNPHNVGPEHIRNAQSMTAPILYRNGAETINVSADRKLGRGKSLHSVPALRDRDMRPSTVAGEIDSRNHAAKDSPPRLHHDESVNGPSNKSMPTKASNSTRSSTPLRHGTARESMATDLSSVSPKASQQVSPQKKPKDNGFKMVIRKIFGRKSPRPQLRHAQSVQTHRSEPAFVTSATDLTNPQQAVTVKRPVSEPAREVTRQSALGSNSPFIPAIPEYEGAMTEEIPILPSPGKRRSSLPSVIFSPQDADASTTERLEQDSYKTPRVGDIGFAITSGSNPKRRSRSADALYDLSKAHRMSPIQWRQWRRRSDEIKHWRESTLEIPSIFENMNEIPGEEITEVPTNVNEGTDPTAEMTNKEETDPETFDFGLTTDPIQPYEKIEIIDDRVVTLEVKMMDLEYAISKLQASVPQEPMAFEEGSSRSIPDDESVYSQAPAHQGRESSPEPETYALTPPKPPLVANRESTASTILASKSSRSTRPQSIYTSTGPLFTRPSVGSTLSPNETSSPSSKQTAPASTRSSLTGLTIEHYITLISLIRREQSARMSLEDQVTKLQKQISELKFSTPSRNVSHNNDDSWNTSMKPVLPYQIPNHPYSGARARPSQSSQETDTDDDGFQDVYETPIERSQHDFRHHFGPDEEGVAF